VTLKEIDITNEPVHTFTAELVKDQTCSQYRWLDKKAAAVKQRLFLGLP
jgi:hypothetical protein